MCTHSVWPFKYVNGVQTPESVLLMWLSHGELNPIAYIPTIPDIEEALL